MTFLEMGFLRASNRYCGFIYQSFPENKTPADNSFFNILYNFEKMFVHAFYP